ncbi:MAG: AbrB/MazE/SpoVT family DNA-binding domain-containing protein [Rhodocyclaceae bacterium]|nr:AbrB/MazE/SpoVT family DNA-binding domain-containing protein [Rhodocyclaceae bacterium]
MNLQIARWGNSLALRIPADFVRRMGVKEGDSVEASLTAEGGLSLRPVSWDRRAFARELSLERDGQVLGTSVMEELRRGGAY